MHGMSEALTAFARINRKRDRIYDLLSNTTDKYPGRKIHRAAAEMLANIEALRTWLNEHERIAKSYLSQSE